MHNVDRIIQSGKKVRLILEGLDGSGKSTIGGWLFNILHDIFPYRVLLVRNPSSPLLYKRMHDGDMSGFEVGMSTLADGLRVARACDEMDADIIIQDRSAIVSGQAYNFMRMQPYEQAIYANAVRDFTHTIHGEHHVIIQLLNVWRQEETVFSDSKYTNDTPSDVYKRFAEQKSDFFHNRIIPYNNANNPHDDAMMIKEVVNEYFSNQNA